MSEKTEDVQAEKITGLDLLREPFPPNLIGKLPKPTKAQTDEVKKDFKKGVRCTVCGGWHHPKVVHLDYVGHAALTDRLLNCDPKWTWEPLSFDENGLPLFDRSGGLWIKLTVCGITRLGYGDAQGKGGGDAIKEAIGDALRNAGMRFGAALDLWHKGDLHIQHGGRDAHEPDDGKRSITAESWGERRGQEMLDAMKPEPSPEQQKQYQEFEEDIQAADSTDALKIWGTTNKDALESLPNNLCQKLRDLYADRMADLQYGPVVSETNGAAHVQ